MYRSFQSLKKAKGLRLVTMNAQSLFDKHKYLSTALNGLDYVGICESWLKPTTPDSYINIPGYHIFRSDRLVGTRGGVACYVNEVYAPFTTVCPDLSFSNPDIECLCLLTKYPSQKFRYIFSLQTAKW